MILRGVAHIHSRYSYDGKLSLVDLRDFLAKEGASFALMTEHTDQITREAAEEFIQVCRQQSTEQFRIIPGFEVPYLGTHILVIGASHYHEGDAREILSRWQSEGALLVVAHPHRNGYSLDEFLRTHADGIEVWNSQYDGIHAPRYRALKLFQSVRRTRTIAAYGSLDLHRGAHRYGPQISLEAHGHEETDIIQALRAGAFSIVRGGVMIGADGSVGRGNAGMIRVLGILMPAAIVSLKYISSLMSRFGFRSFAAKKWLRSRV